MNTYNKDTFNIKRCGFIFNFLYKKATQKVAFSASFNRELITIIALQSLCFGHAPDL